ncbi:MAG: SusC/RagA family TonB-linked outer membrane protein [Cyclobacteriaceae bacterium]
MRIEKLLQSFMLLLAVLIPVMLQAQSTVTGTVTAPEEGVLPGVNVLVKGTTTGTVTDMDGNYRLTVPEGNDVLVFSSIGYVNQEIAINGRTKINVELQADIQSLSEVVVVGYGSQEKKEITSAVASIDSEQFNRGNVNDVSQLLQGKVAGLTITKAGGNPNEPFNIRLRGLSSLGGNSEPLVVVDGVIGADLNSVDPNDIASVDILKDGSAAAIYGSRGSSGVILVTTKTGRAGQTKVDYNGYVALEELARAVDVASPDEFRQVIADIGVPQNDLGNNTNWFEELTRPAVTHVHNLALSGGTEKTTYRASFNLRDGQGVAKNTGFQQLNARLNLTQRALDDRLSLTMNLAGTVRDNELGFDNAFRYATIFNPTAPVFSDDPNDIYDGYFQQQLFDYLNPVAILEQNQNEQDVERINFNLEANFRILDGLNLLARYGQQREMEEGFTYYDKNSFFVGRDRNGLADRNLFNDFNQLFETTLTYDRDFGGLILTGLAGYSFQEYVEEGFGASGGNFITDIFTYNNLGAALDFDNGLGNVFSYKNDYKIVGFFGRLNLNYNGTYFLSAAVRQEGSTLFGEGNKWGTFPAVSGGVTLTNLLDIPAVDNMKLRASYGVTGNTPADPYLSQLRFGPQGNFFFNGQFIPSYGPTSNPNPNLRWERKAEFDVGVDFTMFGDRLNGTIDYYQRITTDLIYPLTVPVPPNLVGTTEINVGEINNDGLELALNYAVIQNDNFTWNTGFNGSYFLKNELVSLSDPEAGLDFGGRRLLANLGSPGQNNTPLILAEEGGEIGRIWGRIYDGVTENGNWRFRDLNEDGVIDDADETVIGTGLPDAELGFTNTFTYGNWDLNIFIRGTFGHDLINTFRAFYEVKSVATSYNVVQTEYYDPNLNDSPLFNSIHVEDADFIKLDNATLGYTLPISSESLFSSARFFLSGQNLFFITNYTGVDPEARLADGDGDDADPLAPGIDRRNTWFRTRTYTLGVNLSF